MPNFKKIIFSSITHIPPISFCYYVLQDKKGGNERGRAKGRKEGKEQKKEGNKKLRRKAAHLT